MKKRIIIGSAVREQPEILKEFLKSLKKLTQANYTADYFFIDDNESEQSKILLQNFSEGVASLCKVASPKTTEPDELKNNIIQFAKENDYDHLLIVDADLVLHPTTIDQWIKSHKDIVSSIFWMRRERELKPHVWMQPPHGFYEVKPGESFSEAEESQRYLEFIEMLKKPGTYEVGGLSSCILISKAALNKGISFSKIKSLGMWDEERHFCIRAQAAGISLFVDTHCPAYPAYPVHDEADLPGIENHLTACDEKENQELSSRFILSTDQSVDKIAGISLPDSWWSRPFEYAWAKQFTDPKYEVLDAGCGISHPFKWLLQKTCKKAWVCDSDTRLAKKEDIIEATIKDLGEEAGSMLMQNPSPLDFINRIIGTICQSTEGVPQFDRIFCISALEHLSQDERKWALETFARSLKADGLIVLTMNYPELSPQELISQAAEFGLVPAASVDTRMPPQDAIHKGSSFIYRATLRHI
jgi:SAM-dependent methyltransferase